MAEKLHLGLDIGNGAVKVFTGFGEFCIESYVAYPEARMTSPVNGYVEYLSGDRTDLSEKFWLGGLPAYLYNPNRILRCVDTTRGKIELALQLVLSVLASWEHRSSFDVVICASVQDGPVFADSLRKALQGEHTVKFKGKLSKVTLEVKSILEEGVGAAIAVSQCQEIDMANVAVYDFGNGTTTFSIFQGINATHRTYDNSCGVDALIDAISMSESVRRSVGYIGDKHLIRAGIESGNFLYGNDKINFRNAYATCLASWFKASLAPFVAKMEPRSRSLTATLAVGGGALLPGLSQALQAKGFTSPRNPRFLNAQGLFILAKNNDKKN
jgi:hypothetical protein